MYWFFLRRETYFRFNRFFLLSSIVVAFALPLANLGVFENSSDLSPLRSISGLSETINIPAVTITHGSESLSTSSYNWQNIALVIYLIGASLLFARVILGITRVEMLKIKGRRIVLDGYSIVYTRQAISPFSFFRTIYLNDTLAEEPDSKYIINHEVIHIKQLHTYDNLFVELFLAIFWFNPFMWLLKTALRENHEYLADNGVLNQKANPATYQTLLLKQTIGFAPITLTSTFNSTIKNRIIMMCKNKSSVFAKFKPLLLVPIIATLFLIFTCSEKTIGQSPTNSETTSTQEEQKPLNQVMAPDEVLEQNFPDEMIQITRKPDQPNMEPGDDQPDTDPETGEKIYYVKEMPTYNGGIPVTADVLPDEEPIVEPMAEPENVQQDTVPKEREVFYIVEEMPTSNDGDPAEEFRKFIAQNLQYPESAARDSISGRVIVQFCVNNEGKVVDPVIVRSASPALDKEAIRVVSSSPLWTPGKQRGKEVNVIFTFPINFVIQ
jgi:TonB family protein